MKNLLTASVVLTIPRPKDFPDPKRYYRSAHKLLIPGVRDRNHPESTLKEIDGLSLQTLIPVIPWIYVQLVAVRDWKVKSLYLKSTLSMNRSSHERWCGACDARGVPGIWEDASNGLACVPAATTAVSDYLDAFTSPDEPPELPEPDDKWSLKERTWFVKSTTARIACGIASRAGLRPESFPPDATVQDVCDRLLKRKKRQTVQPDPHRPSFLGKVWRPE